MDFIFVEKKSFLIKGQPCLLIAFVSGLFPKFKKYAVLVKITT